MTAISDSNDTCLISFNNEKISYESDSIDIDINVFKNDVMKSNEVISFTKKVGAGS